MSHDIEFEMIKNWGVNSCIQIDDIRFKYHRSDNKIIIYFMGATKKHDFMKCIKSRLLNDFSGWDTALKKIYRYILPIILSSGVNEILCAGFSMGGALAIRFKYIINSTLPVKYYSINGFNSINFDLNKYSKNDKSTINRNDLISRFMGTPHFSDYYGDYNFLKTIFHPIKNHFTLPNKKYKI